MPCLSEGTDRMLWEQGLVSLHELAREGTVFGGPEHQWCWGGEESHDYSIRLQETDDCEPDRDQYEMCSRCNHVRRAGRQDKDGEAEATAP